MSIRLRPSRNTSKKNLFPALTFAESYDESAKPYDVTTKSNDAPATTAYDVAGWQPADDGW